MTVEVLESTGERLTLWQRMSVFDARSLLGFYCYRAQAPVEALRIWERIPDANLEQRPEIKEMLAEVRHSVALTRAGMPEEDDPPPAALLSESGPRHAGVSADDPNDAHWHIPSPVHDMSNPHLTALGLTGTGGSGHHDEPGRNGAHDPISLEEVPPHLWSASAWSAATSGVVPLGTAGEDAPPPDDETPAE